MKEINHTIPRSSQHIYFSRAAIGLLAATVGLGVILIYSTLQNINRAQLLMEKFLLDKGETVIRSIEAGSRATMRPKKDATHAASPGHLSAGRRAPVATRHARPTIDDASEYPLSKKTSRSLFWYTVLEALQLID